MLMSTDGVTGRIIDLLRRAAVDALTHKSKLVGQEQFLVAGANVPAIINQRGDFRTSLNVKMTLSCDIHIGHHNRVTIAGTSRRFVPSHSRCGLWLRDRWDQGKPNADTGPMPPFRIDRQFAAENLYALLHPQQTDMAATGGLVESFCCVEPHAVIANHQLQGAISLVQLDPDVLRSCVAHHVGQTLLNGTEATNREIAVYIVQMSHNLSRYACALLVLFRKPPQGRLQTGRL